MVYSDYIQARPQKIRNRISKRKSFIVILIYSRIMSEKLKEIFMLRPQQRLDCTLCEQNNRNSIWNLYKAEFICRHELYIYFIFKVITGRFSFFDIQRNLVSCSYNLYHQLYIHLFIIIYASLISNQYFFNSFWSF